MKHKDYTKEAAIVKQTIDIVYETGIAGIKMSVLAKRVGISPSTLYVYFETKEDLIVSIGKRIINDIDQSLETAISEANSFEEKLRIKWLHMLQFMLNREKEIYFIDQWKQSPYFCEESAKAWKEKARTKSELFDEGKKTGKLKDVNEHVYQAVMSGMVRQSIRLINEGVLKMDQKSMDMMFQIVWDALRK